MVDALKTRFPDCEIDMLVYAGTEQLIADNPQIAQILPLIELEEAGRIQAVGV